MASESIVRPSHLGSKQIVSGYQPRSDLPARTLFKVMATPALSEEAKREMINRVFEALKGTQGISDTVDENKVALLRRKREEMRTELKATSSKLKLEIKKKARLVKKISGVPTNDLVQAARLRFESVAAKAAAKKIKAERQQAAVVSTEVRQPE